MIRAIIQTRKIIERQVKKENYEYISSTFSKYQKGYFWTNENIACYLNMIDVSNKKSALCVNGTGDHIYNLILKGFSNIDTFDINKLTEYYSLGLKKAMILKYDYYNFIEMANLISSPMLSLETLTDIINDLLPYMDGKYQIFWREIINYNYVLQKRCGTNLNLIQMLYIGTVLPINYLNNNMYLLDEYCYEELKTKLNRANITFKGVNALDLGKHFKDKQYDVILLSNILDYANATWGNDWDYEKLEEYLKSLEKLASNNAVIFYKYILSYIKDGVIKENIFHDSSIKQEEIKDKFYVIPKNSTNTVQDAIILRRVQN